MYNPIRNIMKTTSKSLRPAVLAIRAFAVLILAASFSSCARYYYQPNAVNAPMLAEKNDANITVNGMSGDDEVNGSRASSYVVNVQAAYSPIDYMGIMAGYTGYNYDVKNDPNPETGRVDASANLVELGLGGYYPVHRFWDRQAVLVVDTYVGFGTGKLQSDVNMDVNRLFVQPGFSLRTPYFDVGLHGRYSSLKFSNFDTNNQPDSYLERQGLMGIEDKRHSFFEPAVTFRGGYKFVKIQLQHVWSAPVGQKDWPHNDNLTTLGVFFSIDDLIRFSKQR